MYLEALISDHYHSFNDNEKEIARYMIENQQYIAIESIDLFAKRCLTSKSSLLRMTKKMSFSGYSEFKYFLKQQDRNTCCTQNYIELLHADINNTISYLEQHDFNPLTSQILNAKRIYCYATGHGQNNVLNEFVRVLAQCNIIVSQLPALTEFEMSVPLIHKDDLVFIVSLSGNSESIRPVITKLKVRNVPIASITILQNNWLAQMSDYSLFYHIHKIGVQNTCVETISFITLLLALDYLSRKLIQKINEMN